jgi:hypothetical protein
MEMEIRLKEKESSKEDPFLEKVTNSLIIAFVAAAIIKLGFYLYTYLAPVAPSVDNSL